MSSFTSLTKILYTILKNIYIIKKYKRIFNKIIVAFVLAMRPSIILLLLFAFGTLTCGEYVEEVDNLNTGTIIPIKNGILEITIINSIIILNLTKNGELQWWTHF